MQNIEEIPVILKAGEGLETKGFVKLQHFSPRERFQRSLKVFAMCWGAALASLFLPIVHFFLVPALLLAGLIVPAFIFYKEDQILGGKGTCPKCQKALEIEKGSNHWPLSDLCTECRSAISIEKAN